MNQKKTAALPAVPDGHQKATFAAGCYWCVEAVYERLDGVHAVVSGFTGGHVANPSYEAVCAETTGHAEAVLVIFDPQKISYDTLLDWFWRLHDPTTLNRQGGDVGTQYRSAIYYHHDSQKQAATTSRNKAQESFTQPIVTEITQAATFYPAMASHQDYYKINGNKNPYCRAVITPKLRKLKLEK
ncbi:MAG: peptide-methionine (S)-S-oxide reductase MsrA [Verrucomicrobiae bacterium]|nr:peptide-methionine (S)-S-oxide reductase MsrA [Verrucomicrobiae bacterium]NNJ43700.1 peptide-methionine (S)-S-oxide reductase MsrA [Akkermansiaceae bacterium]